MRLVDFIKMLEIPGHQCLDLIIIQPQYIQRHLKPPDFRFLLRVKHLRYPVVTLIQHLHTLQRRQLRVGNMSQLISVQVQVYQVCHAISEHRRIDFFQVVLPQVEHVQISEARERVRRKFVDGVPS